MAKPAIFLVLHTGRVQALIFVGIVVALIAHRAFERNEFSWHFVTLLLDDFSDGAGTDSTSAFANREA